MFSRLGPWSLVALRFLPGLDVMAQPLAGMSGMLPARYLLLTVVGAVLWAGAPLGVGYLFGAELTSLSEPLWRISKWLIPLLLLGAFALYVVYKLVQRWRLLRDIAVSRITVDELKKIDIHQAPV
jgi:membrane protein DedA with SNARE-associated domain